MNFEPFSRGSSILHRTDPRVKIISAVVLSLLIAPCQHFITATAGLLIGVILIISARLPMIVVMRRLLIVNGFNLLLWLLLPLTYGREPFTHFAGITVSEPGLLLAALITIKANAVLMFFISLPATSTVARLGHGLQEMHLSPRLCLLLLFSYRYIFVIEQEYRRLQRAATLRCFRPRTNLHTYRTYGHLLGMLLVKSWNRAARVRQAMELRGFSGTFHCLNELEMNQTDLFILAAMLSSGLGLFFLERM
jgi:cobalt/nickel transport system permease protein